MIERNFYLQQVISKMWNGNIKVITGIRRCGKSTLLFDLFYSYLIKSGTNEENIIKIELDKRKYLKFRDPIYLCEFVENKIKDNKEKYYLFIDEVQLTNKVKDKESGIDVTIYDMLNELKGYKNLDCYVTGSNSKMLSSDIATEFRGRSSQIKVYPLSFSELYAYKNIDKRDLLDEFMQFGGMPGLLNISNDNEKKEYLKNLYSEIYIKDLVEHGKIRREDVLDEMLNYLAFQISSLTNPSNIANSINVKSSIKIDDALITRY